MMRDLRCIMKKMAVCLVALFTIILIVMVLIFSHNNRKFSVAVLKDYNICYGDSPRAVASKTSGTCIEKEQLASSNQTVYTYETEILDMSAKMSCYFLNDKHLSEVEIMIQGNEIEQTATLFERAKEIIKESYKNEDSFVCGDIVFYDESTYSLSLGLKDGAVGIDYTILVKDNTLFITCVDCR